MTTIPGILPRRDEEAELVWPDLGGAGMPVANTLVTPGNAAWPGAFTTILGAGITTVPMLVMGLEIFGMAFLSGGTGNIQTAWEMEAAYGAAAAEISIGFVGDNFSGSGSTTLVSLSNTRTYALPPTVIPAGQRLAVKAWHSSAVQTALFYVMFYGYNWNRLSRYLTLPDVEAWYRGSSAHRGAVHPTGAPVAVTSGAGVFLYGAWTPIYTATRHLCLDAIIFGEWDTAISRWGLGEVRVSGFTNALGRFGFPSASVRPAPNGRFDFPLPIGVKSGEAIELRIKDRQASHVGDFRAAVSEWR